MVENPFEGQLEEHASEFKLHLAIKKHYESCFIGAHNPNLKIMHIANENRDSTQGYFNKMLGVEKGFSDILAAWPIERTLWQKILNFIGIRGFKASHVGVCEVKLPGKPLTNEQNRFMSWASTIRWHTGVARSVRQFHDLMLKWGLKAAHHKIEEPDFRSLNKKFSDSFSFFQP